MELPESMEVVLVAILGTLLAVWLGGVRRVPHDQVGLVERRRALARGCERGWRIARPGGIGWQPRVLQGGVHAGIFPWRYRLHRAPLVRVAEGRIAYVYARNGAPLSPGQVLGRAVTDHEYRDAGAFLAAGGQRGRQRAILREGLHAIHLVQFVVIAEDAVHIGPVRDAESSRYEDWCRELLAVDGFGPVVIGAGVVDEEKGEEVPPLPEDPSGTFGIVTVHDGPPTGECREDRIDIEDPDAFFAGGGGRGRQRARLPDGVYYVNRWFATVEVRFARSADARRRSA